MQVQNDSTSSCLLLSTVKVSAMSKPAAPNEENFLSLDSFTEILYFDFWQLLKQQPLISLPDSFQSDWDARL